MTSREAVSDFEKPTGRVTIFLIAWYALFQAAHVGVNALALAAFLRQGTAFPALPPPEGWSPQAIHFFTAMAAIDFLNALFALLFAYSYFRSSGWWPWLGTVTLTVSVYAAILFDYTTFATGAWTGKNLAGYLFINVAFLPVIVLFARLVWWQRSRRLLLVSSKG